jgi:hypothetical protein
MAQLTSEQYFGQPKHSFWRWLDEDGLASVVWQDGDTLVFRPELNQLLTHLLPIGFPAFESLLVVLAALDSHWSKDAMLKRCPELREFEALSLGLERLHGLPEDLRKSGANRRLLVFTLFEKSGLCYSPEACAELFEEYRFNLDILIYANQAQRLGPSPLVALARWLQDLDLRKFEHKLRTGLDFELTAEELGDADVDRGAPTPDRGALLSELLAAGGDAAFVSKVASQLHGMLSMPKPLTVDDSLSVGGVSDIANRGSLERLLMTEHAQDGLLLALRLAQGEALFTRRESPPLDSPPVQHLLLDTSIFLWGTPRLFAVGVLLSLLRQLAGASVAVLQSGRFVSVKLETVSDVEAIFQMLDPAADCSRALPAVAAQFSEVSEPPLVLLLTHPESLSTASQSPAWLQLATQAQLHSLSLTSDGEIDFRRHREAGSTRLQGLSIDLARLLPSAAQALAKESIPSLQATQPLPAFYGKRPWPLLSPDRPIRGGFFRHPNHARCFGITQGGGLATWEQANRMASIHGIIPLTANSECVGGVVHEESNQACILLADFSQNQLQAHFFHLAGKELPSVVALEQAFPEAIALVGKYALTWPAWQGATVVLYTPVHAVAFTRDGCIAEHPCQPDRYTKSQLPHFTGEGFLPAVDRTPFPVNHAVPLPSVTNYLSFLPVELAIDGQGVRVKNAEGRVYRLSLTNRGLQWSIASLVDEMSWQRFSPLESPHTEPLRLTKAAFSRNRYAVHDPRGYLHLVCGEVENLLTVVMMPGLTAAWIDAGDTFGRTEFLLGKSTLSNQELVSRFTQFATIR